MTESKTMNKPAMFIDLHGVYLTIGGASIAAKKISRKFKIPEKDVFYALKGPHRKKYFEGKMSSEEFWNHASKYINVSKKQLKEIEKIWFSSYKPQKGMKQLVRKLSRKYRLIVLSGNIKERAHLFNKKYNLDKQFHEQHYSFHYGVNKPDIRLFKRTVRKMKVNPNDCIVVDDMKDFLNGCKKLGAKTILFQNAKQLETDLKKLGVKI